MATLARRKLSHYYAWMKAYYEIERKIHSTALDSEKKETAIVWLLQVTATVRELPLQQSCKLNAEATVERVQFGHSSCSSRRNGIRMTFVLCWTLWLKSSFTRERKTQLSEKDSTFQKRFQNSDFKFNSNKIRLDDLWSPEHFISDSTIVFDLMMRKIWWLRVKVREFFPYNLREISYSNLTRSQKSFSQPLQSFHIWYCQKVIVSFSVHLNIQQEL